MNDFQTKPKVDEVNEPFIDYQKTYTYADYLKLEIEEIVEIIRGKIFRMSPAPRVIHQSLSGNIFSKIHTGLKGKSCKVFHAPIDIVLPLENKKRNKSTTIVQPDICVICEVKIIEDKAVFGTPEFIIEIIAGQKVKKDTQIKFNLYEEAGVSEYWIVFAEMRFVEVFILENGRFQRLNAFSEDDQIPCKTLPALEISIDDVFEGT